MFFKITVLKALWILFIVHLFSDSLTLGLFNLIFKGMHLRLYISFYLLLYISYVSVSSKHLEVSQF